MGAGCRRFKSSRPDHFFDRLTLAVFAVLLLLPVAVMLARDGEGFRRAFRRGEKRAPAAFSPRGVEAWFQDSFGLRNELVALDTALTYRFALPSPKLVVGADGWTFLGNQYNAIIDQTTGASLFSDAELAAFAGALAQRERYLRERGVAFVFAVAPNGHTAYADRLPPWVRNRTGVTRLTQVEGEVRRRGIPYADLRAAVAEARRAQPLPLYQKTDPHWNAVGAWAAYRRIMDTVAPQLPGLRPLEGVSFERVAPSRAKEEKVPGMPAPDDVYAYRLATAPRRVEYAVACRKPGARPDLGRIVGGPFGVEAVLVNSLPEGCECTATVPGAGDAPRALVIGDSFSQALSPLLTQTFGATTYTHHRQAATMPRFKALVEKHDPDVVVLVVVERLLNQALRSRGKRGAPPPGEEGP